MFMLTLAKTVRVGDTVECRINLKPARVTREAAALVIEPGDRRAIVSIVDNDNGGRTFIGVDGNRSRALSVKATLIFDPHHSAVGARQINDTKAEVSGGRREG